MTHPSDILDPLSAFLAWLRGHWRILLIILGVILAFVFLGSKIPIWILGGFGAVETARRVQGARKSANAVRIEHRTRTRERNTRTEVAQTAQDAAKSAADAEPPDTSRPTTAADGEARRQKLGRWDD